MTYYILTPASNLANILSTETISPQALYTNRSTGFRRLDTFPNDACNPELTRLHKTIPLQPLVEDCDAAMVIEVPNKAVPSTVQSDDGRIWTAETIYLDPSESTLLFYSDYSRKESFNRTKRSIEAKYADEYYRSSGIAEAHGNGNQEIEGYPPSFAKLEKNQLKRISRIEAFEMIDRLKGAIYCYCIGSAMSPPKGKETAVVKYVRCLDALINIIPCISYEDEGIRKFVNPLEEILFVLLLQKNWPPCKGRLSAIAFPWITILNNCGENHPSSFPLKAVSHLKLFNPIVMD